MVPAATSGAKWSNIDRKSTRLNSSHLGISYAVFCLKKKNTHLNSTHLIIPHAVFWFQKKSTNHLQLPIAFHLSNFLLQCLYAISEWIPPAILYGHP